MGRVFDALRKSSATSDSGASKESADSNRRSGKPGEPLGSTAKQIEEELLSHSTIMSTPENATNSSASTAHTADVPDGSALPGGMASRDAGATLGAAGAARAGGYVSFDISPARVEPHLVAISQPRSAYAEQFRSLRTRVLQAGERLQMRAFVITSAGIGEGKTLTALNLAWLLAQAEGIRALIIDSDLRHPCAADYLGIDAPIGLAEVLVGQARFEDAIVRLDPAGLYLLPGGGVRDDVAELLGGPTFARVLTDARRMFDYVIIDAPPLGIFTDASVLISRADGALLVVSAGKTRYAVVDKLLDQLPRERILGVVLNRTDEALEPTAYYHYRYYNQTKSLPPAETEELANPQQEEVVTVN